MTSVVLLWVVFAVTAGGITNAKGRGWGLGLAWGLLGIFGVIAVMFYQPIKAGSAAAGWYPTPDGAERYWNGHTWSDLPARKAA
jgi:hypothetical protein